MGIAKSQKRRDGQQKRVATAGQTRRDLLNLKLDEIKPNLRERELLARLIEWIQISPDFASVPARRAAFLKLCADARIKFSSAALTQWQNAILDDPTTLRASGHAGREPILNVDEQAVVTGWVLDLNDRGEDVFFDSVRTFIIKTHAKDISLQTVRNYCEANGLAWHLAKVRANSGAASALNQSSQTFAFIRDLEKKGFYTAKSENIYFCDSTFTRHKSIRRYSVSGKRRYVANLLNLLDFSRFQLLISRTVSSSIVLTGRIVRASNRTQASIPTVSSRAAIETASWLLLRPSLTTRR